MTHNASLFDFVVKVIVYGFPALVFLGGLLLYITGKALQIADQDVGMASLGVLLMGIAIIIYIVEFVAKFYYTDR
jgi:hypothetical protein